MNREMRTVGKLAGYVAAALVWLSVCAASAQAGGSVIYPHLISGMGFETRLVVRNGSSAGARVVLTARGDDGRVLGGVGVRNPVVVEVGAHGEVEVEAGELFGLNEGELRLGWVQGESDNGQVTGVLYASTAAQGRGAGLEVSGRLGTRLAGLIPVGMQTAVAVANPNGVGAEVVVRLYDGGGRQRGERRFEVAAQGHRAEFLSEGAGGELEGGHYELESSVGMSGMTVLTGLSGYTVAKMEELGSGTLVFPRVVNGGGVGTTLAVVNGSGVGLEVVWQAYDEQGRAVWGEARSRIAPHGTLERNVGALLSRRSGEEFRGWVEGRVSASAESGLEAVQAAGWALYAEGTGVGSLEAQRGTTGVMLLSQAPGGEGWVLNPGAGVATVSVVGYGSGGERLGSRSVTIGGRQRVRVREAAPAGSEMVLLRGTAAVVGYEERVDGSGVARAAGAAGMPAALSGELGGEVLAGDARASIEVPLGALGEDAVIAIETLRAEETPLAPVGKAVLAAVRVSPLGLEFQKAVRVRMPVLRTATLEAGAQLQVYDPVERRYTATGYAVTVGAGGTTLEAEVREFPAGPEGTLWVVLGTARATSSGGGGGGGRIGGGTVTSGGTGGVVRSADGQTAVVVPPGAVPQTTTITVAKVDPNTLPQPPNQQTVVLAAEVGPSGTQFQTPVVIEFQVPAGLEGRLPRQLPVGIYNPLTSQYETTGFTAVLNADGTKLAASVTHFTVFVILQPFTPFAAPTLPSGTSVKPLGIVSARIPFSGTAPAISSINPTSGPVGTSVIITGTNLNGATSVQFSGSPDPVPALFTVDSPTQITATVPIGTITGPISVTTPGGTFLSIDVFTVTLPGPIITTVAGNGIPGFSGDGGPAISADLNTPGSIAIDAVGNLYIPDAANHRIRKVDAATGIITTVAGDGNGAFSGDGGLATSASLNRPNGVAVDSAGNLYIADFFNHRIRRVDAATGVITTVAGDGTAGFSGDGGPATSAWVSFPAGAGFDSAGNLYIADFNNHRIRRVDAATGIITTLAGNGTAALAGDGGPATSASLWGPTAIVVDLTGNLIIADSNNNVIRRVDAATGIITTVAGTGTNSFSGDGGPATSADLGFPFGVAQDAAGNLFIADSLNGRVRTVDAATGIITTIAGTGTSGFSGDGGPAISADMTTPYGVVVDSAGNVYVSDNGNSRIRKVIGGATDGLTVGINQAPAQPDPTIDSPINFTVAFNENVSDFVTGDVNLSGTAGATTATVTGSGALYNVAVSGMTASGTVIATIPASVATGSITGLPNGASVSMDSEVTFNLAGGPIITTVAGDGTSGFSGDGGPATNAQLNIPPYTAVDSAGNLYIADQLNHRIRRVDTSGTIITIAGTGTGGFSGDGGSATSANLNLPGGVAADAAGNLFIGDIANNRVRRVDAITGIITTVAGTGTQGFSGDGGPATSAQLFFPTGVALDAAGNLYIADRTNHRIRRVDAATGTITTVAGTSTAGFSGDGGPATSANLNTPDDVTVDLSGNLYITERLNHRIRRVDAATGIITTVAGTGTQGFSGDGGPATSANLDSPFGVGLDAAGNLYIADRQNHRVRRVDAITGIITTVAGIGVGSFGGDGGPATSADLAAPTDVTINSAGDIYIADLGNQRIRKVTGGAAVGLTVGINQAVSQADPTDASPINFTVVFNENVSDFTTGDVQLSGTAGATTANVTGSGALYNVAVSGMTGSGTVIATIPAAVATGDITGFPNAASASIDNTVAFTVLAPGTINTVAGTGAFGYSGDGGPATSAELNTPMAVSVDASGNIYISENGNHVIRKVDPTGTIATLAGTGDPGFSGDGGPATAAEPFGPWGVAADAAGNVYFPDSGNQRVRRVDAITGVITTVAGAGTQTGTLDGEGGNPLDDLGDGGPGASASLAGPTGVAVDVIGNLYIADADNERIRRMDAGTGIITTVAGVGTPGFSGDGGPATSAELDGPNSIAVDGSGNLFIAESDNHRVRRADSLTGVITTVAGDGNNAFSGDGGLAINASFDGPFGIAIDSAGNLYIADTSNQRIRKVDTGGIITTVAGNGISGPNGDGGPAADANLDSPFGVAVDSLETSISLI